MNILTVIGARPQFIKAAIVSTAIENFNLKVQDASEKIQEIIVHTGQHYDEMMSSIFFKELSLPSPHYNLNIGSSRHGQQTGEMLIRLEPIMLTEKPDWVMVYGDTNSTLAGALTAAKLHFPIVHVEAGLRSFNRKMPEEINRLMTDHLAHVLFCPSQESVDNLSKEGIVKGVYCVGDVMYDSIKVYSKLSGQKSTILKRLGIKTKAYGLSTIHRAENTDDPTRLHSILSALDNIAANEMPIIMPLHPRTQKKLKEIDFVPTRIHIIEPVSYLDMLCLMQQANILFTDSGGMQKEAYWLKVPCVTLRDETEWKELVQAGCNITAGTQSADIYAAYHQLIGKTQFKNRDIYGTGKAGSEIVNVLVNEAGTKKMAADGTIAADLAEVGK